MFAVLLCAVVGMLVLTSAPALAAGGHEFGSSFGKEGSGSGEFSDPSGVAVNSVTGNVYVVDKGNSRVEEFNPTGTKVLAEFKGSGTAGELSEPDAIAIDNSGEAASEDPSVGDVYVTDHNVVDKFSATGEYKGQIIEAGGNAFEPLEGVAVDPKGVVWVSQEHAGIDAFSDAEPNVFLSSRDTEEMEGLELKPGLAVDSEDHLYVPNGTPGFIAQLNSMGEVLINPTAGESRGRTGVAVEPVSNDVYIDRGNPGSGAPKVQVYTPKGFTEGESPIETFGEEQLEGHGGTALAVSYANVSSGDVYVVDSSAGRVDVFTPSKATVHAESLSFGSGPCVVKALEPCEGKFTEPLGVAVNNATEDVYVVDKGNKRVEEFTKGGVFIAAFSPPGGFNDPEGIAVDNSVPADSSAGDVYVTDQLPPVVDEYRNESHHSYAVAAVDKFSSTGTYLGQLRRCPEEELAEDDACISVGHPTGGFDERLTSVAVSPEGNVWVGTSYGNEGLLEFSDTGTFEKITNPGYGGERRGLAVGAGEIAYVTREGELENFTEVLEFNLSTGEGLSENFNGEGTESALALDPSTGELFVDEENSIDRYASVKELKPSPLESFPSAGGLLKSQGIAVSPASTVYATERTADEVKVFDEYFLPQVSVGAVSSLKPTSVTLQGSVNPEGEKVSSCEFEYGTTTSYGQVVPCEQGLGEAPGEIGKGKEPVLVSAKLSGLPSGTTYHYRLVASDVHGTNPSSDHLFTTPGPSITEEEVAYAEATSATLQAQIDPNGEQTSYHFEYDMQPYGEGEAPHGTSLPVPSVAIGTGTSPVSASVKLQGLEAGKTYYYRAVAEGEPLGARESFYGPNETFKTNPAPSSASPQNCPNEQLRAEQPFGLTLPDCRAYEMVSPEEAGGQDAVDSFEDPNARAAVSGENPAITYASKGSFGNPIGAADTNQFLSRREPANDRWSTQAITPLFNPEATTTESSFDATVFTPELTAGAASTDASLPSTDAPKNSEFKLYMANFTDSSYQYLGPGLTAVGASTDLSRVVFGEYGEVSEWVEGAVVPVGVSNSGQVVGASVGSAAYGAAEHDAWHATSEDGSRVYFTTPPLFQDGNGVLYVRVNIGQKQSPEENGKCTHSADACTIEVSSAGSTGARYWGASADGTKALFTKEGNLYEYSLPIGQTAGHTSALTEAGEVQGVVQISEKGSYVYFVAKGALKGVHGEALQNDAGNEPVAGKDNLYVSHEGGAPTFIATLATGDESDWHAGFTTESGPENNTAVVNPSGTRLAFLSERSLTGYDNKQALSGECESGVGGEEEAGRCQEIFLYDAETGSLVCASCNPTNARPVGPSSFAPSPRAGSDQYRARNLIEDGTLFFDSSDALVPSAKDGRKNVYEYEDGHVYAISNVSGDYESFFLDASASGEDVFFGSADQLLAQDTSENVVVWDARKDGGFPVATAASSCDNADSCKPSESPQPGVFAAPASSTFSGPGNATPSAPAAVTPKKKTAAELRAEKLARALKQCRKEKSKQKRASCERSARKKYAPVKPKKKASANRRTKS
jgi:DNA-binding beta-propeller fold protein YncE